MYAQRSNIHRNWVLAVIACFGLFPTAIVSHGHIYDVHSELSIHSVIWRFTGVGRWSWYIGWLVGVVGVQWSVPVVVDEHVKKPAENKQVTVMIYCRHQGAVRVGRSGVRLMNQGVKCRLTKLAEFNCKFTVFMCMFVRCGAGVQCEEKILLPRHRPYRSTELTSFSAITRKVR